MLEDGCKVAQRDGGKEVPCILHATVSRSGSIVSALTVAGTQCPTLGDALPSPLRVGVGVGPPD